MYRKITKILLIMTAIFSLVGCGKKEPIEVDLSKTYSDTRELKVEVNESSFILTNPQGYMVLYDNAGEKLDEIQLENSSKSDFIYCEDNGEIFSKNLLNEKSFNCIFYAVDRGNGRVYIIKNENNKLKLVEDKNLKESLDIVDIKAYNGMFYYLVKGNSGKIANSYTVAKNDSSELSGLINNTVDVPIMRKGKTYTYIYAENFSSYYLDSMNFTNKIDSTDISNMNLVDIKKDTFKLPYDITSWTITNNEIIFTADGVLGKYDMVKNILEANYGTDNCTDMYYIPGRYARLISVNQMGTNSDKTFIFNNNIDTLENKKVIEIAGQTPMDTYLDSLNNVLYIVYKEDYLSTYGKLKVINLESYEEIHTETFDFVPTHVRGLNGKYYVFNIYEDFYVYGFIGDPDYTEVKKFVNENNANDLLMCKTLRKDYFYYDANNRYITDEGKLLDYRGNLINEYSQKINRYGQLLDDYGRAININGELVDKYNNIIDENGVIIKYTIQKDGYCRSATGKIVDETGKAMIQLEDGTYVVDEEVIPELEWHYDENGEIVINADFLEKYPDAKSWIAKDGTYTPGVSVKTETNETEKQELQENKSLWRKFTDKVGLTNAEEY